MERMKDRFKQYLARRMRAYATKLDPAQDVAVRWFVSPDVTTGTGTNTTVTWTRRP
jgi:DNA-directed RNA polymerase specialized sigma24 family protein